jgi:preprotein translocase subunit SecY
MRSPAARLALTLLLPLLLVVAGEWVLLPGMEELVPTVLRRGVGDFFSVSRQNLSIFALGIMPVVTAYGIVELAAFLVPRWSRLRHGNPEGRLKLGRAARVVAILLAALQAWMVAKQISALDSMTGMNTELPSTGLLVATLMGGVCVQLVVAEIISRQGIANGYVLLVVVQSIDALRGSFFAALQKASFLGNIDTRFVADVVLVFVLPAAATWIALRRGEDVRSAVAADAASAARAAAGPYRAARAMAVAPWVPVPASSITPYPTAIALLTLPTSLLLILHVRGGLRDLFDSLERPLPFTIGLVVLTGGLALGLARLLHRPREMAEIASRVGFEGGDEATVKAEAALRASLAPTLLFFATLIAVWTASRALPVSSPVLFMPLLVALVMDIVSNVRFNVGNSELVAVWQERRVSAVPVVRAVLAAEGIDAKLRGLSVLSLLQAFAPYAPVEVLVAEHDAARATSLLRHVFLGEKRDPADARAEPAPLERHEEKPGGGSKATPWTPARRMLGLVSTTAFAIALSVSANVPPSGPATANIPRGRLEVVRVDDETDVFGSLDDRQLPEGIEIRYENVGSRHTNKVYFARTSIRERETYDAAFARMRRWADTVPAPKDRRIGLEPVEEFDEDTGKLHRTAVRTFVLVGPPVITTDDVLEASASVNTLNANWETYVAITLSPEGAERFRIATRECVDRRIAIIVNDQVESAPIVKSEIGGGRMSITMGAAGSPEEQLAQAKALANSLGGRRANAP